MHRSSEKCVQRETEREASEPGKKARSIVASASRCEESDRSLGVDGAVAVALRLACPSASRSELTPMTAKPEFVIGIP